MKNFYLRPENLFVTGLSLMSLTLVLLAIVIGLIFDLQACKLCLYARWPHFFAILILPLYQIYEANNYKIFLVSTGALALLASFLISGYHSGVEKKIWDGPSNCATSMATENISVDELLDKILSTPVIRCDEVTWDFLSLSMANWNTIISLFLFILWLKVLTNLLFKNPI